MDKYDIIIVGGGLAGLTAAIALSRFSFDILLFEPNPYPHHKVCGEYVSNEVKPYLESLGVDLLKEGAVDISKFEISAVNGRKNLTELPLGGMGISRYHFDEILYSKAKQQGVQFSFSKVMDIIYENSQSIVRDKHKSYQARVVIGAYGKRSALDKTLKRTFSFQKYSWLAIKAHYKNDDFPENLVALHNFEGGYGGLSKTETGAVNFCYLAHYDSFKRYNDINGFNENVVKQNKNLRTFLDEAERIFENPLSIAQISFRKKEPVVNHILMCGDTAGLIHPLCGNGMAMAIHSAKLASECIYDFLTDKIDDRNRLESDYARIWNATFKKRLWYGRKLQSLLLNKQWINRGVQLAGMSDKLLKAIITKTHGKPIGE